MGVWIAQGVAFYLIANLFHDLLVLTSVAFLTQVFSLGLCPWFLEG